MLQPLCVGVLQSRFVPPRIQYWYWYEYLYNRVEDGPRSNQRSRAGLPRVLLAGANRWFEGAVAARWFCPPGASGGERYLRSQCPCVAVRVRRVGGSSRLGLRMLLLQQRRRVWTAAEDPSHARRALEEAVAAAVDILHQRQHQRQMWRHRLRRERAQQVLHAPQEHRGRAAPDDGRTRLDLQMPDACKVLVHTGHEDCSEPG